MDVMGDVGRRLEAGHGARGDGQQKGPEDVVECCVAGVGPERGEQRDEGGPERQDVAVLRQIRLGLLAHVADGALADEYRPLLEARSDDSLAGQLEIGKILPQVIVWQMAEDGTRIVLSRSVERVVGIQRGVERDDSRR